MKEKIIAAALIVCAALCSCSQQESSKQEYYQIVTDPTTEPPTEPSGAAKYVKTAKEETFEATEKSGAKEKTQYKIPMLTPGSDSAKKINSEIIKTYEKDFENAQSAVDNGKTPEISSISYESYLNDIVLTVIITRTSADHTVDYSVYNYNIVMKRKYFMLLLAPMILS